MDKTVINIKTDKKLKDDARKLAAELGLSLGTIINHYLREFVQEKQVVFSTPLIPNNKTQKLLDTIERDIEHNRNLVGPFKDVDSAIKYLNS